MLHRQLLVWFVGPIRKSIDQYQQGEGMSNGRCLCGEVQFSVAGNMGEVRYCHCSHCRRVTGSAFSANARVRVESWKIESGQSLIKEYEQKPGFYRAFCSRCGSPVFARLDSDTQHIRVRLGSFVIAENVDVTGHVWVSSKANWYCIEDTLPRYLESFEV